MLGVPAKFIEGGLHALVEDPFGAGMCLILVGVFFAAKLYRMNLLTISDYYRSRYGRAIEVVCSLIIMLSYLLGLGPGHGAGPGLQPALGRCRQHSHGHDDRRALRAGLHPVRRHVVGGRDGFRADDHSGRRPADPGIFAGDMAGGAGKVVDLATSRDLFKFLPEPSLHEIVFFIGAAVTMMLGSIPQQDIFQRVMSADTESRPCAAPSSAVPAM